MGVSGAQAGTGSAILGSALGPSRRRLAAWLYVTKFLGQPLDFAP
jgi:hypothetical protein